MSTSKAENPRCPPFDEGGTLIDTPAFLAPSKKGVGPRAARSGGIWLCFALLLAACGNSNHLGVDARDAAGVDRSIRLSGSDGLLPLGTPDDAARATLGATLYFSSAFEAIGDGKSAQAKAVETRDCADGGTRTEERDNLDRRIRYRDCLEGVSYKDGLIDLDVTSAGFPDSDGRVTIGEDGLPLLAENRDPADDLRTLMIGTLEGVVTIELDGDIEEVDAIAELQGAAQDLDGPPRVDYALESFHVNIRFSGSDYLLDEEGDYRMAGDCGAGRANAHTPRRLRVSQGSGAISDGELALSNAAGETASAVFAADGSVTVSAGGEERSYSSAELAALCPI